MSETEKFCTAINAALQAGARALGTPPEIDAPTAQAWLAADYDDAEEIADWLRAGCRAPADAARLEACGLTAEQAKRPAPSDQTTLPATLGAQILNGTLAAAEARRIIENDFWHK